VEIGEIAEVIIGMTARPATLALTFRRDRFGGV
jgi:hypothetical protein